MGGETELFRCVCCGQLAPITRLTEEGPFPLEKWLQTYGGKRALSDEELEGMKGRTFRRGGGPGIIEYYPQEVTDELRALIEKRIKEIGKDGGSDVA